MTKDYKKGHGNKNGTYYVSSIEKIQPNDLRDKWTLLNYKLVHLTMMREELI